MLALQRAALKETRSNSSLLQKAEERIALRQRQSDNQSQLIARCTAAASYQSRSFVQCLNDGLGTDGSNSLEVEMAYLSVFQQLGSSSNADDHLFYERHVGATVNRARSTLSEELMLGDQLLDAAKMACSGPISRLVCLITGDLSHSLLDEGGLASEKKELSLRVEFQIWMTLHPQAHNEWVSQIQKGSHIKHPYFNHLSDPASIVTQPDGSRP